MELSLPTLTVVLQQTSAGIGSKLGFRPSHDFPAAGRDYPYLDAVYQGLCSHLDNGGTQKGETARLQRC